MKLLSVTFPESPRGLRPTLNYLLIGAPGYYKDWAVKVKGGAVFLISPPGWRPEGAPRGTQRRVVEAPRAQCTLQWTVDDGDPLIEDLPTAPPVVNDQPAGVLASDPGTDMTPEPPVANDEPEGWASVERTADPAGTPMVIDVVDKPPPPPSAPPEHLFRDTPKPKHGGKQR